ncbi:MAG: cellulase-like family protein [Mariniphaga sp.]
MERREFIRNTTIASSAALLLPSNILKGEGLPGKLNTESQINLPISKIKKPLAIAMWDFSWILRHHQYGEFQDWDKALEGLAQRGYNAIRMDAMPQFIAADKDGKITEEYRASKKDWIPALWGNDYSMSFRPREALLEFLPKCKKYGIRVGLASWFLPHGNRLEILNEDGGLLRAWTETLEFLQKNNLLDDNIVYIDLLNEYPDCNGYDWMKVELNKRSDAKKFILNNPTAHLPQNFEPHEKDKRLYIKFYNDFANNLIASLKQRFPGFDYFTSFHTWSGLETLELTNYGALDFHVWFHHNAKIGRLIDAAANTATIDRDICLDYGNLMSYWKENKTEMIKWIDVIIRAVAQKASEYGIVCGNTEGWGPIGWYDHPDLSWDWVKESAEICVDLAKKHSEYKFICTSNFTHPQFKGLWEDVKWHQKITQIIKS